MILIKHNRYPFEVIQKAVSLYKNENLNYRAVSNKMIFCGIYIPHKTIFEWVNKYKDYIKNETTNIDNNYSILERQVKCNGIKMYMYKMLDSKENIVEIFFRKRKNILSAKKFFNKQINKKIKITGY